MQQERLGSSSTRSIHNSSSHDWTLSAMLQGRQRSGEKDDDDDDAFFPVVGKNNGRIIPLQPEDEHDAMLEAILDVAILASRRAAAIIAKHSTPGAVDVIKTKWNRRDLLTRVDGMCEATIQETVHIISTAPLSLFVVAPIHCSFDSIAANTSL